MIKALSSKVFLDYPREEADKIISLFMENPASASYCRFPFGELQEKVKPRLDSLFMRVSDADYHRARQAYTQTELNFIDRLGRLSGDDRMKRLARDITTAVERTSRALTDFLEVYESEKEIEQAYRDLQSKRTQYRNRGDVRAAMRKRFE